MVSVRIRKFNMKRSFECCDDGVVHSAMVVGRRDTGKTCLVKNILYYLRNVHMGQVVSSSEPTFPFYRDFVPKQCIHNEITPELTQQIIDRQQTASETHDSTSIPDSRSFVVLDNCLYDSRFYTDRNNQYLFTNYNKLRLFYIITMAYVTNSMNMDFIFILRETNISNRRRIYDVFVSSKIHVSFEEFSTLLDNTTENYECLVIDNTNTSTHASDRFFWYKANDHADFKTCHPSFWSDGADTLHN